MTNLAEMIREVGDKFSATASELNSRMREIEMQWDRFESSPAGRGMAANDNGSSLGDIVVANRDVQALTSEFRGTAKVKISEELAAITSAPATVGNTTSPGTSLVPAHRVPGIVTPFERELRVRDLFARSRTTSNSVEYAVETGFTNNAAPVAETTQKPTSDLTFELKTAPVRTIAHLFKASRQILDDAPALASYISRRGVYGLELVIENQLLFGNGTGQNINGLVPQAAAFAPPFTGVADTALDRVSQAIAQVEATSAPVNGIVLHPTDWRALIGTKDADERYLAKDVPFGVQAPTLWGLPVVRSLAVQQGTFLTGSFNVGAEIFDRMETEVLISSENVDDFEKNMVSIRIETRLAMAVYRPTAFVVGDLYPAVSS
ncbi:phage major capsid protein [Neorhizobium sp. CSC1952]|uniref:phage major capsid protein n=1 Tax=Neorhizobium sp. CSC1952 TaxID=2978974 RepID=UPI0025A508B7|nr:phage major capsid protein [Rhizobium sp. CSC1952]WJR68136.1 phage major capsid protein [Rhizobium sp. CSC1952]